MSFHLSKEGVEMHKGNFDHGVLLPKKSKNSSDVEVHGYTDSDFSGDKDEKKSTAGYIFMIEGAPIFWCLRKQALWLCHHVKQNM